MRATTEQDRRVGDILLLSRLAPLTVAAAAAPPGDVGSPHAVLGFGVLTVAAMLALRFTGRRLALYTAIVTVSAVAAMIASLARMVAMTGAVTLFCCVVLACVLAYQSAPAISPSVGRHPAAGVPVGHQSVGFRGSARPAHHRGALRAVVRRSWRGRRRYAMCCSRRSAPGRS